MERAREDRARRACRQRLSRIEGQARIADRARRVIDHQHVEAVGGEHRFIRLQRGLEGVDGFVFRLAHRARKGGGDLRRVILAISDFDNDESRGLGEPLADILFE
ncbi:MAG: hypothetical protein JO010_15235 [Alphaproteobacteria bacterium]|nr:hypothetical protein [Alphaproteobacteria bacterium]